MNVILSEAKEAMPGLCLLRFAQDDKNTQQTPTSLAASHRPTHSHSSGCASSSASNAR